MSSRSPIQVPGIEADAPTYRYWGKTKPPENAAVLCAVDPRVSTADPTKATLRIYGPIDSWGGYWGTSAKDVAAALDQLGEDVTEIQLRVNSGGGSVFEGLAILNLLRAHPAKVTAVVDGLAASAASFIVAGCDARVMSPGTQLMIHDPWSSAWGCNSAEMRKQADTLDKVAQALADLYADVAGGTSKSWRDAMVEETWYTAAEAVAAGLADEVAVVPNLGAASTAGAEEEPEPESPDELLDAFDLSMFAYAGRDHAPAPSVAPALKASATDFLRAKTQDLRPPAASAGGSPNTEGGAAVSFTDEQLTTMRATLGLPETADEATIVAAVSAAAAERPETPTPATSAADLPEGLVVVDAAVLEDLRAGAAAGIEAQRTLQDRVRDEALDAAIADGRIHASRREHYAALWAADEVGTRELLAQLAPGLIPVTELGSANEPENTTEGDALYASLFPEEAPRG